MDGLVISNVQEERWLLYTPFLFKKISWSDAVDSESLTNFKVRSVTNAAFNL